MGHSKTYNYQVQLQYHNDPEGRHVITGADTWKQIEAWKCHKEIKYAFVWAQTARGKRTMKGFDYVKVQNGVENQGFSLQDQANKYFAEHPNA